MDFRVPLQTAPSATRLVEVAIEQARRATDNAEIALRVAIGETTSPHLQCTASEWGDPFSYLSGSESTARAAAMFFIEAAELVREATLQAAERNIELGDAHFAEQVSAEEGARLAYSAPIQSRAHAAHLIAGGDEGLHGVSAQEIGGLCTLELSPSEHRAVDYFRIAGIAPSDLLAARDIVSTQDLLVSSSLPSGYPSVREMLIEQTPNASFGLTASSFVAELGLDLSDFDRARSYMEQEIAAFGRPLHRRLAPQVLPGGALGTRRYAATATRPTRPPEGFYPTVARYSAAPPPSSSYWGAPAASSSGSGLLHFLAYAHGASSSIVASISIGVAASFDAIEDISVPLALYSANQSELIGRLNSSYNPTTGTLRVRFAYQDPSLAERVRLVVGDNALRCATTGTVDGSPCELEEFRLLAPSESLSHATNFGWWRLHRVGYDLEDVWTLEIDPGERFYVVAMNESASIEHPGSYRSLAGEWVFESPNTYYASRGVSPFLDSLVSRAIEPSVESCVRSRETCAGARFDERIALENELSDDGDGVESSWRTYLALARQAAAEADLLGERVIDSGLELDVRAEAAEAELAQVCGAALNADVLREGFARRTCGADTPCAASEVCQDGVCVVACSSDAECTVDRVCDDGRCRRARCANDADCAAGADCYAGVCVENVVNLATGSTASDPNLQRLAECVGDDAVVPAVALGTAHLCYWRSSGSICGALSDSSNPSWRAPSCPQPRLGAGCSDLPALPEGVEWEETDEALGYFETDVGDLDAQGAVNCADLRAVRDGADETERMAALRRVFNSYLSVGTARRIARALTVRPNPNFTTTVLVDGRPMLATGDLYQSTSSTVWPCGAPDAARGCAAGATSLFCSQVEGGCADVVEPGLFGIRLRRAALAARLITDTGIDGLYDGLGVPTEYTDLVSIRDVEINNGGLAWTIRTGRVNDDDRTPVFCFEGQTPAYWPLNGVPLCQENRFVSWRQIDADSTGIESVELNNARRWFRWLSPVPGVSLQGDGSLRRSVDYGYEMLSAIARNPVSGARQVVEFDSATYTAANGAGLTAIGPGTYGAVFDAMELLCEAGSQRVAACPASPPQVSGALDLEEVRAYLECTAGSVEALASRVIVTNLPRRAMDALREQNSIGAVPSTGGEFAQSVTRIRSSLISMSEIPKRVASNMRRLANAIEGIELSIKRRGLTRQLDTLNLAGTVADRVSQCASQAGGLSFGAVATCANSTVQIGLAIAKYDISDQIADVDERREFVELRDEVEAISSAMEGLEAELLRITEQLDSDVSAIDSLRTRARRALARAAFLDNEGSGAHYAVSSVMRRRFNTNLERYAEARESAVRAAYLARRAVEQRLGVRLSDLHDDLTLVEAPASWADQLCTMSGVDYGRLREGSDYGSSAFQGSYASRFVGSYVDQLGDVVESYRLDYPFQQGADTAVVSVRDDIQRVRQECAVPVANMLARAGDLSEVDVWSPRGCRSGLDGRGVANCVTAVPLDHGLTSGELSPYYPGSPFVGDVDIGSPPGFRILFGDVTQLGTACSVSSPSCGFTTETELSQRLDLAPGRYRLSWYSGSTSSPELFVEVRDDVTGQSILENTVRTFESSGWSRSWTTFEQHESGPVRVAVVPVVDGGAYPQSVDIAGVMLERVVDNTELAQTTPVSLDEQGAPGPFIDTDDGGLGVFAVCEDRFGHAFREGWQRGCVNVCEDGIGCSHDEREAYCYWETELTISQYDIEAGRQFGSSGFARGNFNYRVDTMSLNFVGAGIRDCSESSSPSTCYSSGYVPYSIEHIGPYTVRNHLGEDYDAPLFTGRIEHARGLAAERYLTNPLSSTDRALIEPYMRRELRGRPLDGTYVIRVWDEEGFNFHGIEDVQVVLNYAYWTRTD